MTNVLSLFDGMSCGRIALERAEVQVENYFSSEIKPYAIKVADANYPQDSKNRLGDVTQINPKDLPKIDLLIGGSPCQDFSQANRSRLGYEGNKSKLFFEYVRILKECQPKYFLLENVRMKKEHQDFVSAQLKVEPISINSELVSPQLRHRLYWTNIPLKGVLEDRELELNNFLDEGYSDRKKARALLSSERNKLKTHVKMAHRYFNVGFGTFIFKNEKHFTEVKDHFYANFKGKTAREIDEIVNNVDLSIYGGLRYLNQREREMSNCPRRVYKLLNRK